MTSSIIPYDLAEGIFCEECRRPKSQRLFSMLLGCKTCDEVITRHRCTSRPDLDDLAVGESWECPECGSSWTAIEEEDTCGECGRSGMVKAWNTVPGPRLGTAPRYQPPSWTPLRNPFRPYDAGSLLTSLTARPERQPATCYRMGNGSMVHVRPGCRCPR